MCESEVLLSSSYFVNMYYDFPAVFKWQKRYVILNLRDIYNNLSHSILDIDCTVLRISVN